MKGNCTQNELNSIGCSFLYFCEKVLWPIDVHKCEKWIIAGDILLKCKERYYSFDALPKEPFSRNCNGVSPVVFLKS